MTKLVTTQYKRHFGGLLTSSVLETQFGAYYLFSGVENFDTYYVFAAKHVDRTGEKATPTDNIRQTLTNAYREMIFGKKVNTTDVSMVIRNIPYESNKLYTMYDDLDSTMFANDFYCVVDEDSFYHVYKCLDNNLGANSTVQPQFSHVAGTNTTIYQTSDGYRWKYLYSISSAQYDKFATDTYIPFIVNTEVTEAAVNGSVEIIKIEVEGKNYNNYTSGTFNAGELRVGGNTIVYEISNSSASTTNGYYTGCLLYLSAGSGVGQYRTIVDYYSNSTGNYAVVNSQFTTAPENGTVYEINPQVQIYGDGSQTVNAIARALINSVSTNSVYRIEPLNIGQGYKYATANVIANAAVGVTLPAEVRPIMVPSGGHGKQPCCELGITGYCVGVTFSNSESNTILYNNSYDQIGIIKNPKFANVVIEHAGNASVFLVGEYIRKITPVRFQTNATVNTTSALVSCNTGDFSNQLANGDLLYLQSSNGSSHMFATVNNIVNSTTFSLTTNALFACTDVDISFANTGGRAELTGVPNNDHIVVTGMSGSWFTDDYLIGESSGAKIQISTIKRNGVAKGFNTFMQLHKYTGSVTAGTFQQDEPVFQGSSFENSTANGYLHSVVDSNTFWVSSLNGNVSISEALKGSVSGATAAISEKYDPEVEFGSGNILYIENIDTVTRANMQSESIKLIFEF